MKIEIWSDVMCPFCYIGKRRLEKALASFEHAKEVDVVWKSFQLNPNQQTNPDISVTEDLAAKKGWTLEYTKQMSLHVINMAADDGLIYNLDNAVVANSFKAHRLLQFSKTQNKGDLMEEALFKAYFTDGKNTDDADILLSLAVQIGLPKNKSEEVIKNEYLFADEVNNDIAEAQKLNITGVPFFVLDRKYGISGAQNIDLFSQTIEKAFAEWKGKKKAKTY